MRTNTSFGLRDLAVLLCIAAMMLSTVLPAIAATSGRSRAAVCRNNLKAIGVGLEVWKQHTGRYPWWDLVGGVEIYPWLDVLAMQNYYRPENLESLRSRILDLGVDIDDMVKTIDDTSVFMCPADHPHPHRINEERAHAWGYWRSDDDDGYQYSYTISSIMASSGSMSFHPDPAGQILSADGVWSWSHNLSGFWVEDPSASFSTGGWYCNTVGYWHKRNSASFVLRDLHVENHSYPPDTNDIFFSEPGESLTVY